jgi:hypothetical protein
MYLILEYVLLGLLFFRHFINVMNCTLTLLHTLKIKIHGMHVSVYHLAIYPLFPPSDCRHCVMLNEN